MFRLSRSLLQQYRKGKGSITRQTESTLPLVLDPPPLPELFTSCYLQPYLTTQHGRSLSLSWHNSNSNSNNHHHSTFLHPFSPPFSSSSSCSSPSSKPSASSSFSSTSCSSTSSSFSSTSSLLFSSFHSFPSFSSAFPLMLIQRRSFASVLDGEFGGDLPGLIPGVGGAVGGLGGVGGVGGGGGGGGDDDSGMGFERQVHAGRTGRTSLEQQRWIKAQKIKNQQRRLEERKRRGQAIPVVLPQVVTPKTLSSLLGVRAVDIVKSMIKMGLDPKTAHEVMDDDVVDVVCQDFWYTPVRMQFEPGSMIPSRYSAYLSAVRDGSLEKLRQGWDSMTPEERKKEQLQAEKTAKQFLSSSSAIWKKIQDAERSQKPVTSTGQQDDEDFDDDDDEEDDEEDDDDDEDDEEDDEEQSDGDGQKSGDEAKIDDDEYEEDEYVKLQRKREEKKRAKLELTEKKEELLLNYGLLRPRAPVVTVLGHVNHGKTTLLDRLHGSSQVVKEESGGITQHVRSFQATFEGKPITFFDTPGHSAFSSIRKRGTDMTDIVLLLVAIDAGVKPQTIESAKFALERDLPIILVFTKCDRDVMDEDIETIAAQLSDIGVVLDVLGGNVPSVQISALTGRGLTDLQELILLQAEDLNLLAEELAFAEGTVIETTPTSKGLGIETIALVQWGTLSVGDTIVVGQVAGKVKMLFDVSTGANVRTAKPSQPVRIIGLKEPPMPGDVFQVLPDERQAKAIAHVRAKVSKQRQAAADTGLVAKNLAEMSALRVGESEAVVVDDDPDHRQRPTQSAMTERPLEGVVQKDEVREEFLILLKTDVHSSFEAIQQAIKELIGEDQSLIVRFISSGPGIVSELDVDLAKQAQCPIICFKTQATARATKQAEQQKISLQRYDVIYDITEEIRKRAEARLLPHVDAQFTGDLQVLKPFSISVKGTQTPVAGARVVRGELNRNQICRLSRGGKVMVEGPLQSLKFFKDDIQTVKKGMECGLRIEGWDDYQVGDQIQAVKYLKTPRGLGETRRNDYRLVLDGFRREFAEREKSQALLDSQKEPSLYRVVGLTKDE